MHNTTTGMTTGTTRRLAGLVTAAVVLMAAALAGPARSSCSGLLVIPTADIVEHQEYCIDAEMDWASGGSDTVLILNTEFGLLPNLELGLDFDFSDGAETTLLLNAKYLIVPESEKTPAIAVGVWGVGQNLRSSLFAAVSKDFRAARGHIGLIDVDGNARWFVGADKTFGDRLDVYADYMNGDESYSSLGVTYALSDSTGITGGVMFANAGGDTWFTIQYSFGGSYKGLFGRR